MFTDTNMLVAKLVQISVFGLAMLWDSKCEAASTSVKLCGRALGDIMSRVCHEYNSPPWDVPTGKQSRFLTL